MRVQFHRYFCAVIFLCTAIGVSGQVYSAQGPQTFTLDGYITAASSSSPLLDTNAKIEVFVLDPSKQCVLYAEEQFINTNVSQGYFNINIGSDLGDAKRIVGMDPGSTMVQVFSNSTALVGIDYPGQTCPAGVYTPASKDQRYFRIVVTPSASGVADTLSPDAVLDAVPMAMVAEDAQSLRGFTPSDLLRVNTSGGVALSQANLEAMFTGTAYTNLQDVMAGNFTSSDPNAGTLLPSYTSGTPPSTPSAGSIWYDSTTGQIKYHTGATTEVVGLAGSGVQSVSVSSNLQVDGVASGTITNAGTIDLTDTGVTAGTYPKVSVDAKGRVTGSAALVEADLPTIDDAGKVSGDAITSGTIGGTTAIATSGSVSASGVSARVIDVYDSDNTNFVRIQTPVTGSLTSDYTLTLPANDGSANQVLQTDGSGALSWITPLDGTVTAVSGSAPISVSNGSTTPVISISQASGTTSGYLSATDWTAFNNKLDQIVGEALSDGQIWIGDGFGDAQERSIGGDATMSNTGVLTISSGAVSFDKIQDVNSGILLGRTTALPGDVEQITTGTGLSLSGGVLSATGLQAVSNTASLAQAKVWVGDASGISQEVSISGDASLADDGTLTLNTVPIAKGGTNSSAALSNDRIMISSGGAIVESPALADGQILIGDSGSNPKVANLTAGAGVTITNAAGGITIAASGSGGTVTSVTASAPLASSGGNDPNLSISQANSTTDGYLSSTDWNTFNNKFADSVSAQNRILGRHSAGAGIVEELTIGTGLTIASGALALSDTTDDDSFAAISCANDEVLRMVAGAWVCVDAVATKTNSSVVFRDGSGDFAARNITADGLIVDNGSGTAQININPPLAFGSYTLTLPNSDGSNGQVLSTDGSGSLAWVNQPAGDNLGNHIATQNVELNGNWLSGDGDNEGLSVNASGNVGLGTADPKTKLHVAGTLRIGDGGEACDADRIGGFRYNGGNMQFCDGGGSWQTLGVAGSGITALTGDVVASGTGSVAASIASGAVSYAKIQDVTDNRILGRSAGSAGTVQEIQIGTGLSLSGGTLSSTGIDTVSNTASLANAKVWIGDGSGVAQEQSLSGDASVSNAGVLTIASGAVNSGKIADGTVAAADLATDSVETAKIKDDAVTFAKLQDLSANNLLLGRFTGGAGSAEEISLGSGLSLSASGVLSASGSGGTVTNVTASAPLSVASGSSTPHISLSQADGSTDGYLASTDWSTFNDKFDDSVSAQNRLLGRHSAGSGAVEELTIGTGLTIASGALALSDTTDDDSFGAITCANDEVLRMVAGSWACVDAVATKTNSSVVYRDSSGDFAARNITADGLIVDNGSGTAQININPPLAFGSYTLTLPNSDGSNGQVLSTDGSGTLGWVNQPAGDNLGNHVATQNIELDGNWLSGDGDNEGLVVNASGNVGIGTSNPSHALSVAGDITASSRIAINDPFVTGFTLQNSGKTLLRDDLVIAAGAIRNNNYAAHSYMNLPSDPNGWQFYTTNTAKNAGLMRLHIGAAADNADFLILNSDVGVGTADPKTKLHVAGTLRLGDGGEACDTDRTGGIRYNGGNMQFCDGGGSWQNLGVAGSGITALTGDVTASGSGSVAATIASGAVDSGKIADGSVAAIDLATDAVETAKIKDDAVTFAKIQNLSGNNKIVGRYTAGAGSAEEISLGSGLSLDASGVLSSSGLGGTVTSVSASAPLSVVNASSTPAISISQANSTTDGYLSSTDWNTFNDKFDDSVSAQNRLLGRHSAGSGAVEELTIGTGLTIASGALALSDTADDDSFAAITCNNDEVLRMVAGSWACVDAVATKTNSSVVYRDGSGDFAARNITADGIVVDNGSGTAQININPPLAFGTYTLTLPNSDGSNGQVLSTDGSGVLSWANQTAADNLGDHTATQNIVLGSNWLSGDGNNEGVTVNSSGQVGIGKAVASQDLDILDSAFAGINLQSTAADAGISVMSAAGFTSGIFLNEGATTEAGLFTQADNNLMLRNYTADKNILLNVNDGGTNKTALFVEGATGNVGIGTTAPSQELEIRSSTSANLVVTNFDPSGNPGSSILLKNYRKFFGGGDPSFQSFVARGTEASPSPVISGLTIMSLQGRGYAEAGFGDNRPGAQIDFVASSNWGNSNVQTDMLFSTAGTGMWQPDERMRITANGKVGINQPIPNGQLDVKGSIVMSGATSGYSGFQPPATAPNVVYTLPASSPLAGQILSSNATGDLTWMTPSTSAGDFKADGTVPMTGVFRGIAGTAALPGISFVGDTDTGISAQTADNLILSAAGVEKMRVSSTGVGIGGVADAPLYVSGGSSIAARVDASDNSDTVLDSLALRRKRNNSTAPAAGHGVAMAFEHETDINNTFATASRLSSAWEVAQSGAASQDSYIGISTSLDGTVAEKFRINSKGVRIIASTAPASPATGDIYVDSGDANKLKWWDGDSWESAGGGGGVTADSLDFTDFKDAMALDASTDIASDGTETFSVTNTGTGYSLQINDQAADTTPVVVDSEGRLGVGVFPTAKFHVVGTGVNSVFDSGAASDARLEFKTNGTREAFLSWNTDILSLSADADGELSLGSGGAERVRIDSAGKVGIGTVPSEPLHVKGTGVYIKGETTSSTGYAFGQYTNDVAKSLDIGIQGSARAGTFLGLNNTSLSTIASYSSPLAIGTYGANKLVLGTNNAEALNIDGTQRVGIGVAVPQRVLHVGGPIRVTASTVPSSPAAGDIYVDSADSNKLKWWDGDSWESAGGGGVSSLNDLSDADTPGTANVFVGNSAGNPAATGAGNSAFGYAAMNNVTSGYNNVALGRDALAAMTTGGENVAIGHQAQDINDLSQVVSIGSYARNGGSGVSIGHSAQTTGIGATLVGKNAGLEGNYSVGMGYGVSDNGATEGGSNVLLGYQVGYSVNIGSSNVIIGSGAGNLYALGNSNILIGANAEAPAASSASRLNIGNTIYGDLSTDQVGIGTASPRAALDINGTVLMKPAVNDNASPVDFGTGNLQYTTGNCGNFTFYNIKDGGSYTFAVQGTTSATCAFTMYDDAGTTLIAAGNVHMPPDHGATTASKHTLYTILRMGAHVYVSWMPGL